MSQEEIDRFWSYVDIRSENECWNWKKSLQYGYGQIGFKRKVYRANRIAYYLTYGEIPEDLFICHKCNNKACCNPNHLYAGTAKENSIDAKFAGVLGPEHYENIPKGECHKFAKLSEKDVLDIKSRLVNNESIREIAKQFNVTYQNISLIKTGRAWKHVK